MVDMLAVEVWFFVLWSIIFSATVWMIFTVAKTGALLGLHCVSIF